MLLKNFQIKGKIMLKDLFRNTRALIIGLVIILAGVACYVVYSKVTKQSSLKPKVILKKNKQNAQKEETNLSHQKVVQVKPMVEEKVVRPKLTNNGLAKKEEEKKTKNTEDIEAERKKRYPFTAHKMTEAEKRFKDEALKTQPVTNIIVHDRGVVFFWATPKQAGDPEKRKEIMENLAYLYRDICKYEKPVTVVFFISGRPVQAVQFFK